MLDDDQLLVVGALGLGLLAIWKGRQIVSTVNDFVGRGALLTDTETDASGVVEDAVEDLVAQASAVMGRDLSADVYALARMARSEGIDAGDLRVHVALNDLQDLNSRKGYGWSPVDLITYSTSSAARGHFGTQTGRRYASSRDPYQADVVLVEQAMADHAAGVDPTGGAVKFVDKSSFGVQAGTGSYDALVASWAGEGLVPYNLPGQPDDFVVFRRA